MTQIESVFVRNLYVNCNINADCQLYNLIFGSNIIEISLKISSSEEK